MKNNFTRYIIFWLSQALSQLGSSMTSFALILWAYTQNGSAMTVSLMSFCNYMPYIIVSLFAGAFVDTHSKKKIMLVADCVAAACAAVVLAFSATDGLQIYHIYLVNAVIGFMNAFQGPASAVAVGKIVPQEKLSQISGMNSFSSNLNTVLSPVLASALFVLGGLKLMLVIDLATFVLAFVVLFFVIHVPEELKAGGERKSIFAGAKEGFAYLKQHSVIRTLVITMAFINFVSRLTYENILSPMILARSGNDSMVLGAVNAAMGIAGIVGGVIVATGKFRKNPRAMIYVSAMLSFLLGDITMGLGRNVWIWFFGAMMASIFIPFIMAGQNIILYGEVPTEIQGRIFAVRNALQYSTIPVGILLGGFLADYVFEPFMQGESAVAGMLQTVVGTGAGSGMAVMFLCTGIAGSVFSFVAYRKVKAHKLGFA